MKERAGIINGEKKEDGLQGRLREIMEIKVVARRGWKELKIKVKVF